MVIKNLKETGDIGPVIDVHLSLFLSGETRSSRPQLVTKLENLMRKSTVQGIISAQMAMAGRDNFLETLKAANIPILLLAASEDKIIPLQEYIDLSKTLPAAQLQIIENCGHISNLEQPEIFNQVIHEFVNELD
jgi:pimeloyl-ACP methyl ester carboxylesterase